MIVDIRRGLSEYDLDMLSISKFQKIPVHILMTKSDKLKRGEAKKRLLVMRSELEKSITVQLFSSLNREGLDEARITLDGLLREEIKEKT
jgi:GTP-binding protein